MTMIFENYITNNMYIVQRVMGKAISATACLKVANGADPELLYCRCYIVAE